MLEKPGEYYGEAIRRSGHFGYAAAGRVRIVAVQIVTRTGMRAGLAEAERQAGFADR